MKNVQRRFQRWKWTTDYNRRSIAETVSIHAKKNKRKFFYLLEKINDFFVKYICFFVKVFMHTCFFWMIIQVRGLTYAQQKANKHPSFRDEDINYRYT